MENLGLISWKFTQWAKRYFSKWFTVSSHLAITHSLANSIKQLMPGTTLILSEEEDWSTYFVLQFQLSKKKCCLSAFFRNSNSQVNNIQNHNNYISQDRIRIWKTLFISLKICLLQCSSLHKEWKHTMTER